MFFDTLCDYFADFFFVNPNPPLTSTRHRYMSIGTSQIYMHNPTRAGARLAEISGQKCVKTWILGVYFPHPTTLKIQLSLRSASGPNPFAPQLSSWKYDAGHKNFSSVARGSMLTRKPPSYPCCGLAFDPFSTLLGLTGDQNSHGFGSIVSLHSGVY